MNKELFSYLVVALALFVGAFYYSTAIQSPIISALNTIKISFHSTTQTIQETIQEHFFQADEIQALREKLQKYENNHLVMQELADEINDLYQVENSPLKANLQVSLVRTISYQKFGNFNRLWLEVPEYNNSKIYGLTYNELVAGIVIDKDNRPLALLNQDIKSAYSVMVGDESAPGIAHGNNNDLLTVSFIPAWYNIEIGDEVVTSGLDKIFIKGLKVGKVLSVSSEQGYQIAVIQPYYKAKEPSYFHMIRSVR